MRLRVETFNGGRSTAVLFEGLLLPRKKTRGLFERYIDGLQTPVGLPLSIQAVHAPESDTGELVVRSGEAELVRLGPLCRGFGIIFVLPTEEELCIMAAADH